jgi:hypothetical protein
MGRWAPASEIEAETGKDRIMQTRVATAAQAGYSSAAPEGAPALPPRISWGAVLAGGLVAVAVGAMAALAMVTNIPTSAVRSIMGRGPSSASLK